MAELNERLKRKRSTIRSLTTKLLQKIERQLELTEADIVEIEETLDQISLKETLLCSMDEDIEKGIEDLDELDLEVQGAQEYQERIAKWKFRSRSFIRKKKEEQEITEEAASSSARIYSFAEQSMIKLPRLTVNKYYGDASNWQEFWNQFDSAIHRNETLRKADKFSYLKSYLGGKAANAVSGLTLSDDNYDAAILTDRFGRKDLVINAHMNKLLNLTAVKRSSDLGALRQLYDVCEIQVRSLESLGVVSDSYGSILCPILLKLIPDDIALEFSRSRKADKNWNVTELLRFLQGEIECRERALILHNSDAINMEFYGSSVKYKGNQRFRDAPFRGNSRYFRQNVPTAATLTTVLKNKCVFCEKLNDHKSDECQEISAAERKNKLKVQGRCYLCLGSKHTARFCRSKVGHCIFCGRRHNKSICDQNVNTDENPTQEVKDTVISNVSDLSSEIDSKTTILLQTAVALAKGQYSSKIIRCLLDGGSQRTFIQKDLSRALRLPVVGEETLLLHTFGTDEPIKTTMRRVRLYLENVIDSSKNIEVIALETSRVCSAVVSVPGDLIHRELNLRGFQFAEFSAGTTELDMNLSVLIGADNYWKVVSGRIERMSASLVALETKFGWCVQGPTTITTVTQMCNTTTAMKVVADQQELVSDQLRKFWELENLGIMDNQKTDLESEEELIKLFESNINYKDGRYEVRLPWKLERGELFNNFEIAEKRMMNLIRKFKSNSTLHNNYKKVICDQISEGVVEKISERAKADVANKTYYMPHHAVIREDKSTTKYRIVFDASSHKNGCASLNDCLSTGPNLNPDLLAVLIKFRQYKIAFVADIEKAFLQISMAEEDRDAVRFLWLDEACSDDEMTKLKALRMTRVPFGVSSSPFILAATIRYHIKKFFKSHPDTYHMLNDCLYVDDLIAGSDELDEAFRLSMEAKEILCAANMELKKWETNSKELQRRWKNVKLIEQGDDFDLNKSPLKVLGLAWNSKTDEFKFELTSLLKFLLNRKNTKRCVLQTTGRIFDPIGFLSPFVIRVKCLFQELWVRGLRWDDELPQDIKEKWNKWCLELPKLERFKISRAYILHNANTESVKRQLHCFCDASERAYGAVVYIRHITKNGHVEVGFVVAKARVAPLKRLTLPRLELMGALIGARLIRYVNNIFKIEASDIYLWSDSTITLHWIRAMARQWKPFVANRVIEIQSLTDPKSWSHCSGKVNPADVLTRGQSVSELINNTCWWTGPNWLLLEKSQWPQCKIESLKAEEVKIEQRSKLRSTVQLSCNLEDNQEDIFDLGNYSALMRVFRVTGWIQRFIKNVKGSTGAKKGPLTAEELAEAERYWTGRTQLKAFRVELTQLKAGTPISKESRIVDLNPFLDENGLICVGGRLQRSTFSFNEKHPWILPSKERFCHLQVQFSHERVFHSGLMSTLMQVREKFWILKGRQFIKSVIQQCLICKKLKAQHGAEVTAPLPGDRIKESPPFEVSGVDFAGPLYTKGKGIKHKSYIVLFCCAVTRAVHLELVSDLSTAKFLLALRRFISRRGLCKVIYSDNAKSFKRANKDLQELWQAINNSEIQDFYGNKGISWKFIVERAAWWGGFWERMVRSIKTPLRKILGRACLSFEELETILTEVEAVINSRPMTFVYNDSHEPTPLSPAHFLVGKRLISLPAYTRTRLDASSNREELSRRYKYQENIMNRIWKRWRKEYLLELRSANFSKPPTKIKTIDINDVVPINCERNSATHVENWQSYLGSSRKRQ